MGVGVCRIFRVDCDPESVAFNPENQRASPSFRGACSAIIRPRTAHTLERSPFSAVIACMYIVVEVQLHGT